MRFFPLMKNCDGLTLLPPLALIANINVW